MVPNDLSSWHRVVGRLCVGALLWASIAPDRALAQAAPALSPPGFYNPEIGLSVGQVLGNGLAGRGVPVNDNLNTAKAVGAAAQTALDAASQLTGGGLRGKTWAAMLALGAAGTAIAGTVFCFTTSYCWDQTSDGKVHPQQNAYKNQPTGSYPAMDGKRAGYLHTEQGVKCYSTTLRGIAECSVAPLNSYRAQQSSCNGATANTKCDPYVACNSGNDSADYCTSAGGRVNAFAVTNVAAADMPAQCQNGVANVATSGKISCGIPPQAPMPASTDATGYWDNLTPAQALDGADTTIPASVQASPLSSGQIKDLTNELWKQAAAAPGYQGVPYQPLTQAEADTAYNQALQQGLQRPTVRDMLSSPTPGQASNAVGSNSSPGAATGVLQGSDVANKANYAAPGVTVPTSGAPAIGASNYAPTTSTAAGPVTVNVTVNPVVSPKLDLGPDPGVKAPDFGDPPGWQKWYDKFKGSVPFLDTQRIEQTQLANGAIQCPTDSFSVWGKTFTLDAHCTMLDQRRDTIRSICKLLWMLSTFLVLWAV